MSHLLFSEAVRKAQAGQISQSIETLQRLIQQQGSSYSSYSNLATLYLQLGDLEASIQNSTKAASIDPFAYIAYYNRFLCYLSKKDFSAAWNDLQRALSCIYMVKGYDQGNLKFLNKSIRYCEQNVKAYLIRAKYHHGKNNKLAENDYSAAIEYGPDLPLIYQQRAIFYRGQGKKKQFEQDLATYLRLKKQLKGGFELVQNDKDNSEILNLREKILNGAKEFQELLVNKVQAEPRQEEGGLGKLPLESTQSKMEERGLIDEQMLISDRPSNDGGTGKTLEIKKEEINFRRKDFEDRFDKNFRDIFQDENSKDLNEQIEQLEREIQAQGGKTSLEVEQDLQNSDNNNFLTYQIQKAIEQIQNLKNSQTVGDLKSVRSAGSNVSRGSKLSQTKQITIEELKNYKRFYLQVVDLSFLQNPIRKEEAKVLLRYGNHQLETKMQKLGWREKFTLLLQGQEHEIEVTVVMRGSVFNSNITLGEGTINLLELGNNKCILANKQKKTAMLHIKLKLQ